jgi:alpha-L-fucosidase 2
MGRALFQPLRLKIGQGRAMDFTRRGLFGAALAGGVLAATRASAAEDVPPPPDQSRWTLWYRQPAQRWVEALPIGNGRLGAMLFGDPAAERLQLNEDSFWDGGPYDPSDPGALEALREVRRLIWAGRYAEAQALADARMMARPRRQMSYSTLGELRVELDGQEDVDAYRRWLDLDEAIVASSWQAGGRRIRRQAFASVPDQVLVIRIEAAEGTLSGGLGSSVAGGRADGSILWLTGRNRAEHGVAGALTYAIGVQAIVEGGRIEAAGDRLAFRDAGAVELLVAIRTSYGGWRGAAAPDPEARVRDDLARASAPTAAERRERHLGEHRRLFRGFDLDLGADPDPQLPTDVRIRYSHDRGGDDPFLAALYVQYGRYLLLSSSRPGAQPANLQGLWNDSDRPPWGSKYTININTEMNYWPAEPLGLAECIEPLIAMVEDLAESGVRTARTNYGARGWVAHHNTDLWRATAPIDGARFGMWPTGGAWLCKHLWDRWDYGRDRALLRRIYPLLKGAALFFLDTLVQHPAGHGLVTAPSVSPENLHPFGAAICAGPAMDRQILRELFANVAAAARLLDQDADLIAQVEAAERALPPDRIGRAGQLQEWLEDWDLDAPEIQHRHVSHLYALHPGHAIGPETPALNAAARRSLEIRGDDATGWGIGWRINLWARLGDGARAYSVLRKLLGPDRTYPNMFDAHPPFQIDGNLGGAAGVVEMLVRDRPQGIHLLPALPPLWRSGRLRGVRLRGGLTADIGWRDGVLDEIHLRATVPAARRLAYRDADHDLRMSAGRSLRLHYRDGGFFRT